MAICQSKRQPDRLLTLADENLLIGIGHLVIGGHYCIASSRASGVSAARRHDHTACCKQIETGQRPLGDRKPGSLPRDRSGARSLASKVGTNFPCRDNFRRISHPLLHCCNTCRVIAAESGFECGDSL
jgi:hypothetical protein